MAAQRIRMIDASWLLMESRDRPMHVATLLIYSLPPDAPPDFLRRMVGGLRESTEFVEPFNKRLASPTLRALVPMWVQDFDLDMEYHVRHLALPQPGGERELGVLISRLHSAAMDFRRPLWEYHVIEGLENSRFAVYFKMHHSLVDGIAGIRMLQRSMSARVADINTPALWSAPVPVESSASSIAQGLGGLLAKVTQSAGTVVSVARGLAGLAGAAVDPDNSLTLPFQTPVSILNHRIRRQRRFATQVYELARIKRLAKAAGCTLNDIVLALCSGALRRFLQELCALPGRSLTAGIPVSLRTMDDQGSGTAVTFIIATLATNVADPARRLAAIKISTERAKSALQGMTRDAIELYTLALMAPYTLQTVTGLEGRTRPVFNVAISNVPGPAEPLYFRGARLEAMYPVSAVTHGQALNITCYSYAGTFSFGFAGCRDTIPRLQRLAVYTGEALEELERTVLPPSARRASTAAVTPGTGRQSRSRRKRMASA
jgi:diacylglycerol O-acyltransferase / wax synthase